MSISYNLPNSLQLHGNMYDFSSFELKAELSIFSSQFMQYYSVNLLHFHLLQNHFPNFNQTWHKASLSKVYSVNGWILFEYVMIKN